ncbi:hypothetical protein [Cronobacter phage vB_Cdu_VP8]|nr:hypothetical protein [Cronobacter phage vB_Cdu_VP8]
MIGNQYWFRSTEDALRWQEKCPQNMELARLMEKHGICVLTQVDTDFNGHPIFDELIQFNTRRICGNLPPYVTRYELSEYFHKIGYVSITESNSDSCSELVNAIGDEAQAIINEWTASPQAEVAIEQPTVPETKKKKVKIPRGVQESLSVHINKTIGSAKAAREMIKYLQDRFSV